MQKKSVRTLGTILFLSGIFLGLALAVAAIWGDFEGFSYFNTGAGYSSFNGLDCPVLMTRSETGTVTARFKNSSSEEFEPYYETAISGPASSRKFEGQLSVPAHMTKNIQWTVDANDVDLGFFIFVDMNVLPVAGYSTREDTCGIVVLDIPFLTGGQVLASMLTVSLIGILVGLGLWERSANKKSDGYTNLNLALRALGISSLLAVLTSMLSWWAAGLIFCVMAILLLAIILRLSIETR
jgi:hypothetical protein